MFGWVNNWLVRTNHRLQFDRGKLLNESPNEVNIPSMMERSKTAINLFRQNRPMGGHLRLWTQASCNKSF